MNVQEFFVYIDAFIIFLVALLLYILLFRIAPRTYKFYKEKHFGVDSDDVKKMGYLTDGGFWKWLSSKDGWVELYQDAKQQQIVYYNNFKFFNLIWKITFVLLVFRVLVIFFGPVNA